MLSLAPGLAAGLGLDATGVNAVYFAGSLPFTAAALLQLLAARRAPEFKRERRAHDKDWQASALQFGGTLLFNLNTADGLALTLDSWGWWRQDLDIWVPDVVGSALFLASGCLVIVAAPPRHRTWRPSGRSWWINAANLFGCLAFMASAVYAYVPPAGAGAEAQFAATLGTLLGACGFLVGSLLMLADARLPPGQLCTPDIDSAPLADPVP